MVRGDIKCQKMGLSENLTEKSNFQTFCQRYIIYIIYTIHVIYIEYIYNIYTNTYI